MHGFILSAWACSLRALVLTAARARVSCLFNIFCFSFVMIISLTFTFINQNEIAKTGKIIEIFIKAREIYF